MKLTRSTYLLLLFIIIGIAIFFIKPLWSENNKNEIDEKKDHERTTEPSEYRGIDIKTVVIEEEVYKMAIHYPDLQSKSLNKPINAYISQSKKIFFDEIEHNLEFLKQKDRSGTYNLSFDIYEAADNIYSIVFMDESYVAGANGKQSSKVFMVNKVDESFISSKELLIDNSASRSKIHKLLLKAFQQSDTYKDFFFEEELKKWIEDEQQTFEKTYITKENLVFKFDKYEVTAGAAGSPEIAIPISDAKDIIKSRWLDLLDVEDKTDSEQPDVEKPEEDNADKGEIEKPSEHDKKVALTFDDGPHPENTLKILELLDEYGATATFFMLGNRVDFYQDIVKEVSERGHEIGNHTWNHKQLTKLGEENIKEEINRVNQAIQDITGEKPTVFRPPYGASNALVDELLHVPSVLWNIDTLDWKSHDPNKVLEVVKTNLKPNAIILMHDIHETTVEAVALVLDYLESEGYTSVGVSDVLQDKG
ncbi:Peptidoglycan-N-acetylmuramic acid deacetylase PdaC [Paraliobacillus sp. PM-2]|uniref:polysaccharide deacetylase family protein n=1 Tax=Paraliobacillus sp. PM-2 TaxID=1462524 RepID=UPI00061C12FC|nr:polysaccharide deacetylase family protein [Paraliobacillus sp. PM-2]CQR47372.1 Peptidoglycan-N-acetylmuramic acid deacetylase PdaC [Paraliobacillus sp. PM-2]